MPERRTARGLERLAVWHVVGPVGGAAFVAVREWGTLATSILVGVLVAATVLGTAVLFWLRRPRSADLVARADRAVFVADVCLLVAAGAVAVQSPFALLVVPLLVALNVRRLAVPVTAGVLVAAVILRELLLDVTSAVPPDRSVTVQLVLFGTATAGIVKQMLDQLDARRLAAEQVAARARIHERRATTLHQITLAGVGATRQASVEGALTAAQRLLPGSRWAFLPAGQDGPTALVGWETLPDPLAAEARDVLTSRDPRVVDDREDELETATIMYPVVGRAGPDGVLLVRPAGSVTDDDRALAAAAADLLAVLIEAAASFEHETELVDRYRALDRLRSDFVSLTSHELRTPATVIQGFAETLASRDLDDMAVPPLADAIARHARRLGAVVDDLRLISTIDAGRLHIEAHPIAVIDAVRDALDGLGPEGFTVEGPRELRVVTDPGRLTQILGLLLQNARLHGAEPITLRWRRAASALVIDVADEGPGIPEHLREAVFERFRTGGDMLSHHRGTGLGLPIARELAGMLDGQLDLVPSAVGTVARLTLPEAVLDGTG